MSAADPVVIVGMARTPMGGLLGELGGFTASDLGAVAIEGAVKEAGVKGEEVDLVYMGNCLPAGQGQAPARQAGIKAKLPKGAQATTINKMCGSGMQAAVLGRNAILAGEATVNISGAPVEASVLDLVFDIDLDVAKAHVTARLYVAEGRGVVAEERTEELRVLGIFPRKTVEHTVLTHLERRP